MEKLNEILEHNWLSVYDEAYPEEYEDIDEKEVILEE